jgi:hypothetical protein
MENYTLVRLPSVCHYTKSVFGSAFCICFCLKKVKDKKTRLGREKPPSPTSPGASTQGAHNPLMAKKSRNQQVPVENPPEPWPPITNGPATTAHSATAQAGGWLAGDGTWERTRHNEEIFLTRPEIRPTRGLNPRPRGATRGPQPSGLRTFREKRSKRWTKESCFLPAALTKTTFP